MTGVPRLILTVMLGGCCMAALSQDVKDTGAHDMDFHFSMGADLGLSCSYTDEVFLFSVPVSVNLDYHFKKGYYLQFAPKYTWLFKWNEHYLSLPLHLKKRFGNRISLFAGPALTFDVGYFRDI